MYTVAAAALALAASGCRLDPLVKDTPGASAHLLPAGADVPEAASSPDLTNQINLNDGIDDKALVASGGIIPRGTGFSGGMMVRYWSFGPTTRAPSPLYKFVTRTDAGDLAPISHPPLVDALPGDAGYSAVHSIINVVVTPTYEGQLITTTSALADAIDLGIIEQPMPTGRFVASPIVLLGTPLDVGDTPVMPETVYGRGYAVGAFELGGTLGVQPGGAIVPASQVSFLREPGKATFDAARPIFQARIPTAPPAADAANYTPLAIVVNVDLVDGPASSITSDEQLFDRTTGAITNKVAQFQITTSLLMLPIQFKDGAP